MNVLDLQQAHVGEQLRIETKVKSRPITGVIATVQPASGHVRVELTGAFGKKWYTLTPDQEISLQP
nr:hypothetical protein [Rhodococcus sp. (in: high G+C Gram-positive bacteria)]